MKPFKLSQPLKLGTTLIEASAGTGKTYSIATLVVRLIGESQLAIQNILVVTFTVAATAELKHRIRARIFECLEILRSANPEATPLADFNGEGILEELLTPVIQDPEKLDNWKRRLEQALESFDGASIYTIHGFCQKMLTQYAFESRVESGLKLEADQKLVVEQIVNDYYSSLYHSLTPDEITFYQTGCQLTLSKLQSIAKAVSNNKTLDIYPKPPKLCRSEWDQHVEKIAEFWRLNKDKILGFINQCTAPKGIAKLLSGQSYSAKHISGHVKSFEHWLENTKTPFFYDNSADPSIESLPRAKWFQFFTASFMKTRAHKSSKTTKVPFNNAEPLAQAIDDFKLLCELEELGKFATDFVDGYRVDFGETVREKLDQRANETGAQSFDDLIVKMEEPLRKEDSALRREVALQFKAALIDEFQDTDELQWSIFQKLFGHQEHYLYLIGDPKQAIYSFRGANINVYREARQFAEPEIYTMDTNFRSDGAYVEAMNHVLHWKNVLGGNGIDYTEVKANHQTRRMQAGDNWATPLSIKLFDQAMIKQTPGNMIDKKTDAEDNLADVVASEMVDFLKSEPKIYCSDKKDFVPVSPGDLAVLVGKHKQAKAVQKALRDRNVPAIIASMGDVFASDEAMSLIYWLAAILRPGTESNARRCITSPLFGFTATDLTENITNKDGSKTSVYAIRAEDWVDQLVEWRNTFDKKGFMRAFRAMLDTIWGREKDHGTTVPKRLLTYPDGERRLTNLYHLAELLHEAHINNRLGLDGLLNWLEQERAKERSEEDALEMRLETDAAAVKIATIHSSKGLEYPFVWAPYLWNAKDVANHNIPNLVAPIPDSQDLVTRTLNLQSEKSHEPKKSQIEMVRQDLIEEQLRLLYVALTRASLKCTVHWGRTDTSYNKPFNALSLVLLGSGSYLKDPDRLAQQRQQDIDRLDNSTQMCRSKKTEDYIPLFDSICDTSNQTVAWSMAEPAHDTQAPSYHTAVPKELQLAQFNRYGIDHLWAQNSYSGLTSNVHTSFAEDTTMIMENVDSAADRDADSQAEFPAKLTKPAKLIITDATQDVPFASFRGGADAGVFIHKLYEEADFQPALHNPEQASEEITALAKEWAPHSGLDPAAWTPELTEAFVQTLLTPLGGPLEQFRLCDIPKTNRLDEMAFDFPIAGGSQWHSNYLNVPVLAKEITAIMSLHRYEENPHDDTMRAEYICRDFLGNRNAAGFMTGLIDLVFKTTVDGVEKWFIADYKSNKINPHQQRRYPQESFSHEYMRYAMESHNYYIQYHLYTVALHRFLKYRLGSAYTYEENMGGSYYLFVRGMVGADTPSIQTEENGLRVNGCFYDKPHAQTIQELDELFSRYAFKTAAPTKKVAS